MQKSEKSLEPFLRKLRYQPTNYQQHRSYRTSLTPFQKLIRFHRQAFIIYKNGENLKILIEIFVQEVIASNVILAFLDHLKSKIFFVSQPWWPT